MEELKKKARALGLWNMFLPKNHFTQGAGFSNLEYGLMAELLGKSARSDGAVLADRLQDAVARARLEDVRLCRSVLALVSGDKHNMNVT